MRPSRKLPLLLDREPPEVIVVDEIMPCPYIEGQRARLPMRMPLRAIDAQEWGERLAEGDRRHGVVFYRTACPDCQACEPIRVDARRFEPSRGHRRVQRKAGGQLRVELGEPLVDERRLSLYEAHLEGRGLRQEGHVPITPSRFRSFLVESSVPTFEVRYYLGERLVGVAVTDRSAKSLSAHYTYYDPSLAGLSVGTFSILTQLQLCREWELEFLYLGLYVGRNDSMRYKARFRPHERRIAGLWLPFER